MTSNMAKWKFGSHSGDSGGWKSSIDILINEIKMYCEMF